MPMLLLDQGDGQFSLAFGVFFSYQLLMKNGLDVLESRRVVVNFLKCGLFGMLGCLWTPRLLRSFLLHTQGRPGISFVSTTLLLPFFFFYFTRTFHVKTASLGDICKENDD